MEGYDAATYGDRFADVYDDWYDDPAETHACVLAVAALARAAAAPRPTGDDPPEATRPTGDDPPAPDKPTTAGGGLPEVLELGVGTGRLALPLAGAGLAVTGLDASAAMLDRLRAKPGAAALTTVQADMAGPLPDGPFDVVLVARNTFFNLTSEAAQAGCLAEVARVLAPHGRLVVEAFVPGGGDGPRSSVEVRDIGADRVRLFVDRHDRSAGEVWSSFVDITPEGITFRPCHVRYLAPAGLDALAADAGLVLDTRHASWDGAPFDDDATHHVSTYRRA